MNNENGFKKMTEERRKTSTFHSRKADEIKFHNKRFRGDSRSKLDSFYDPEIGGLKYFKESLTSFGIPETALEYGSGIYSYAHYLAEKGSKVTGIDISEVAIKNCKEKAIKRGVTNETNFLVMDAEFPIFSSTTFDLVFGSGILHHLELGRALREISRMLKPGGRAVFLEPLGHNPFIRALRRLTPNARTRDEHPLLESDISKFNLYFNKIEFRYYGFTTLLALPFKRWSFYTNIERLFNFIDMYLFKFKTIRNLAWTMVITFAEPRGI